jgi:hypothetical protein
MNTAPASGRDADRFRERLRAGRPPGDVERMRAIAATTPYLDGDLGAEADYYRLHFRDSFRQPAQLEAMLRRLRANFTPRRSGRPAPSRTASTSNMAVRGLT